MAYFVVQRNADSMLSVPLPELFPTREAAIAALSSAAGSGAIALDSELFIADLGAAAPVLMVQVQPPGELGTLDEQAADEVYAPSPLSAFSDEASLAAALKRAASSLEDEGIVAPASVESEPVEAEDVESADETDVELPAAEPVEEPEGTEGRTWPWANVDAYEPVVAPAAEVVAEEPLAEDEPALTERAENDSRVDEPVDPAPVEELSYVVAETVAEPLGVPAETTSLDAQLYEITGVMAEPIADDQTLITSAPSAGEDAYLPRPVILGDYSEAEIESPAEPGAAPEDPALSNVSTFVADAPEPAPEDEDTGFDLSAALGGLISAPAEVGFEATGELDLAEYTCQDCIYSNTCPKVGQAAPSDCGSFQWRSE